MPIFSRFPPWRRALPWVLLAISLGFNVAFFLGQRWHDRLLADVEPTVIKRARLSPDQAEAYKQLRARMLAELIATGREGSRRAGSIWDDLREPPVDRPAVDRTMREMGERRMQAQARVLDDVIQFLDSLPADQRAEVVDAVRRRDPLTRTLLFGSGGLPRPPRQPGEPGTPPPPAGPVPR